MSEEGLGKTPVTVKPIYFFDEADGRNKMLLGGKGAGLAEMSRLGLPVPPGFIITTEICEKFYEAGKRLPDGLMDEVRRSMRHLESLTGKKFGESENPLLVSVRSGAAVSMPGMMDTILNLGLNDDAVEGLMQTTGNARFARDSYRRLLQMFGEVVDGIDGHRFEQELGDLKRERGVQQDIDLTDDDLAQLIETFKGIYRQETGDDFPQDAREQLGRAVLAVFQSWENPRAQGYRRTYGVPDDIGTAVNGGQMGFG